MSTLVMYNKNFLSICWCAWMLLAPAAWASSEALADARALGMGDTRIAFAYAPTLNPALLSLHGDKQLFWDPPALAVRISDPQRVAAAVTGRYALRDYYHGAGYAARGYVRHSLNEREIILGQERFLLRAVQGLSQYAERADVQASAGMSLPNPVLGAGVYSNAYGSAARLAVAEGGFHQRAVAINELGLALARQFAVYGDVSFGVAPKRMDILTYERVSAAGDATYDRTQERIQHDFNVDFGVARRYETGWSLGGAVTNLLPVSVTAASGDNFRLLPNVRFGLSFQDARTLYAADVDMMDQQNWVDGAKRRYFGLGVEHTWHILQMRAGYRHNLAVDQVGVASVGLGVQAFGFHMDAALAGNAQELGASAQLGYRI